VPLLSTPVTNAPEAATRSVEEGEQEWSRRRVQFAWPFRGASWGLTADALVVAAVFLRRRGADRTSMYFGRVPWQRSIIGGEGLLGVRSGCEVRLALTAQRLRVRVRRALVTPARSLLRCTADGAGLAPDGPEAPNCAHAHISHTNNRDEITHFERDSRRAVAVLDRKVGTRTTWATSCQRDRGVEGHVETPSNIDYRRRRAKIAAHMWPTGRQAQGRPARRGEGLRRGWATRNAALDGGRNAALRGHLSR
jgi:hypothetical protein